MQIEEKIILFAYFFYLRKKSALSQLPRLSANYDKSSVFSWKEEDNLNVKYNKEDKLLVMEITEEIDHHTTEKIRRRADYEIQRYMPKKVLFDFNNVSFMDSSGIGMVVGRYKLLAMLGGSLELANVNQKLEKVFEMSGVLKIIPIHNKVS